MIDSPSTFGVSTEVAVWQATRWGKGDETMVSTVCDHLGAHLCYFLEDALRPWGVKVAGKTAIPPGLYALGVTHNSPLAMRYYNKYPAWFRGLPTLEWADDRPMNPEFTLLRVHSGLDKSDTRGCPLTAREVVKEANGYGEDYVARGSVDAMQDFCLHLYATLPKFDRVFLKFTDDVLVL